MYEKIFVERCQLFKWYSVISRDTLSWQVSVENIFGLEKINYGLLLYHKGSKGILQPFVWFFMRPKELSYQENNGKDTEICQLVQL